MVEPGPFDTAEPESGRREHVSNVPIDVSDRLDSTHIEIMHDKKSVNITRQISRASDRKLPVVVSVVIDKKVAR